METDLVAQRLVRARRRWNRRGRGRGRVYRAARCWHPHPQSALVLHLAWVRRLGVGRCSRSIATGAVQWRVQLGSSEQGGQRADRTARSAVRMTRRATGRREEASSRGGGPKMVSTTARDNFGVAKLGHRHGSLDQHAPCEFACAASIFITRQTGILPDQDAYDKCAMSTRTAVEWWVESVASSLTRCHLTNIVHNALQC
jgi:hypothetical protein